MTGRRADSSDGGDGDRAARVDGGAERAAASAGFFGPLRTAWRRDRAGLLAAAGFLFTWVVFLVELPFFLEGGVGNFLEVLVHHLYVLGVLLAVTWFTRTIPLKRIVSYWFVGVFPALTVALVFDRAAIALYGGTPIPATGIVVPVIEEVVKLLPVVAFLVLASRGVREPTASDGLLVAFAVGAGFGFHESMLFGRSLGVGVGPGFASANGSLLFPIFVQAPQGMFAPARWTVAHAGWTTLAAVGVSVAFVYRHRLLAWPLAVPPLLVAIVDHAAVNYGGLGDGVLEALTLRGVLPMYLLLFGILGVVLVDLLVLSRAEREWPQFPGPTPAATVRAVRAGSLGLGTVVRLVAVRQYARRRRATLLAFRRWDRAGRTPEGTERAVASLTRLSLAAGVGVRPASEAPGEPSETSDAGASDVPTPPASASRTDVPDGESEPGASGGPSPAGEGSP